MVDGGTYAPVPVGMTGGMFGETGVVALPDGYGGATGLLGALLNSQYFKCSRLGWNARCSVYHVLHEVTTDE